MATDLESLGECGACVRAHDHLLGTRRRSLHIQPFTVHSGRGQWLLVAILWNFVGCKMNLMSKSLMNNKDCV